MLNKILLLTATEIETQNVLDIFSAGFNKQWVREYRDESNRLYYLLKDIPDVEIILVQSEAGTSVLGGSELTVSKSIMVFSPRTIIMIGIAFGVDPQHQNLGDILVSHQLKAYEPGKVKGKFISRGDRVTVSPGLLARFRSGKLDWQGTKDGVKTDFGLIVSGEKLVDDIEFRDWLVKNEPDAIGGEMEAAGLYVAAQEDKVDWIVAKGISDWGDGNKKDDDQYLAARNATSFVLHVIQNVGFGIDIRDVSKSVKSSSIQEDDSKSKDDKMLQISIIEYRESLLAQIQETFIYQIEKELIEHMDKYFSSSASDIEMSQNYMATLYFSQELQEMSEVNQQLKHIYRRGQPDYLSEELISIIKFQIQKVEQHSTETYDLINQALDQSYHPLGISIKKSLEKIKEYIDDLRVETVSGELSNLWSSLLRLQLELEVYQRGLLEVNKFLQENLAPHK